MGGGGGEGGGGANETKVDQTTEMYFYLILFNWRQVNFSFFFYFVIFFIFFNFLIFFFQIKTLFKKVHKKLILLPNALADVSDK